LAAGGRSVGSGPASAANASPDPGAGAASLAHLAAASNPAGAAGSGGAGAHADSGPGENGENGSNGANSANSANGGNAGSGSGAATPGLEQQAAAFGLVLAGSHDAGPLAAATAAGAADAPARQIAARYDSPGFAPALGAEVTLLVRDGVQQAQLHLNPGEMGPITVQIQLDGTSAQVNMAADHAQTRHALEQAMPALASALRETGLTLTGGGVFEQSSQAGGGSAAGQGNGSGFGSGFGSDGHQRGSAQPGAGTAARAGAAIARAAARGGVDLYA
ncbi:MAG: flagellar hook-length control protein FliK, partial [Burkholderiales bacterium]|nr:flagellar hook-length control protein FliK [Burkholderiales bacterium]